ncbi:tail fiber domain-containing protein [Dyadobacter aurulentus]|uniref:tail fiber domain-containing protein n=1 Tax=Dyadobacter sp. UC 10 TaxID=2605428 RepID=UPI0011F0E6E7|nr:tail fiber domain-containing protein [Dyadobacter sp. UC 10]KAA0992922.1 hypothetical protein FXO21_23505 [Dyadobacter sp. UC 10]
MKKLLTTCILSLLCLTARAQNARDFFTFQGVARDEQGHILANRNISVRFGIHPFLENHVYREEHKTTTNTHGVFTVLIGSGTFISGNYSSIQWEHNYYFLQIEIDSNGGSNYISIGSTQLVSVPYALHAKQADKWKNNDPIVQTGDYDYGLSLPLQSPGIKLIWYPKKAAFRAGYASDNSWDDGNIGMYTTAFGYNTKALQNNAFATGYSTLASGSASFASGTFSKAAGAASFAAGNETSAKGDNSVALGDSSVSHRHNSFALGYKTEAGGDASLAMGAGVVSKAYAATALGSYNNVQDNPQGPTQNHASGSDRIFQIGNGSDEKSLSNAFTVLRNGNIGLGNGALIPQYILDIGGRPRIRHSAETAGLYLDNSNLEPKAFMGMKTDDQIGFYLANAWRFWVNGSGGATLIGGLDQVSDRRLKRDFANLSNSLGKLSQIDGVTYYWKDQSLAQTIQTGLIAQNVETVFPELVTTNAEGFKSVNYIGLIPHLIESVKELKQENASLKKQLERIDELEAKLNTLAGDSTSKVSISKEVK